MATNSGIGFAENTSILMYNATTKKIQDIKIGDEIMGPGAIPKTITKVIQRRDKMYDIISVKGTPYTVPGNHILALKATNANGIIWVIKDESYRVAWLENFKIKTKFFSITKFGSKLDACTAAKKFQKNEVPKHEGYTKYGAIVKISVNNFMKLSKRIQRLYKGFSTGIKIEEKEIDVDPYILGYWLGDGTSGSTGITTAEPEIVEYFENYAEENNLEFKKNGNSKYGYYVTSGTFYGHYGRNPFLNFLKKYDLLNNKHIPDDYKMNSSENRLKLLAGLIDSDGYNMRNTYDFVFKSEKLADDTIFLARSLGFKALKTKCKKTCTNSSRGRVTGIYYRFTIYGEGLEKIPSILERKQAHKREQKKNASVTGIKIKSAGKQDYYVLETDTNRFLLDDFTVVHK